MDHEQKYKNALERAKKLYEKGTITESISYIFPELAESEDEKIRKQIISFLKEFEHDHYRSLDFSSWIDWLERQGKKESEDEIIPDKNDVRDEDEKIKKVLIDYFNRYKEQEECGINTFFGIPTDNILAWLEKQGTSYTKKDVDIAYIEGINAAKNEIEKQYEASYQIRKDIATFIFNYRGDIKDRAKWMDYLGVKVYVFEKEDEKSQDEEEQIMKE